MSSTRVPAVLRLRDVQALLVTRFTAWFVMSALTVVVGYQVYLLTHDPLALGLLGLVEALPALSLSLLGGHLADRRDRRTIYVASQLVMTGTIVALALLSIDPTRFGMAGIFAAIFVTGIAAGFQRPANTAFEAQVIPVEHMTRGASLSSGSGQMGGIIGPAVGGLLYAVIGVTATYVVLAAILLVSVGAILLIAPKPMPVVEATESLRESLASGLRFVRRSPILLGGMSLDLFAVLFGGAVAMLPIFASDILNVGPGGLGLMRTAPSVGALLAFSLAAWRPPKAHAGLTLLACVAGFGVSIIVFALSTNFLLVAARAVHDRRDGRHQRRHSLDHHPRGIAGAPAGAHRVGRVPVHRRLERTRRVRERRRGQALRRGAERGSRRTRHPRRWLASLPPSCPN